MIQSNKSSFLSEQDQRASSANPLAIAQNCKSQKVDMVEWSSKQTISSAVLGKGEQMFKYSDGGRSKSRRPRQSNDCTMVALAIACELPYDAVYDYLKEEGRKCWSGFRFGDWVKLLKWNEQDFFGYDLNWFALPAKKGELRVSPDKFCEMYPKGTYILRVSRHVIAVKDGVYYDHTNWGHRCVYGAWKIEAVNKESLAA